MCLKADGSIITGYVTSKLADNTFNEVVINKYKSHVLQARVK